MKLFVEFSWRIFDFWCANNCWNVFKIVLYFTHNFVWNRFSITRRLMSLTCNCIFHIVDQKIHDLNIKIYKKFVMIAIHRLWFCFFDRLLRASTDRAITRKNDIKCETRSFIFWITNFVFTAKWRLFFIFQNSKCSLFVICVNSWRYISCFQSIVFKTVNIWSKKIERNKSNFFVNRILKWWNLMFFSIKKSNDKFKRFNNF